MEKEPQTLAHPIALDRQPALGGLSDLTPTHCRFGTVRFAAVTSPPEGPEKRRPSERFRKLPERTPLEDMIATRETTPAPDPTMGRDPERDSCCDTPAAD